MHDSTQHSGDSDSLKGLLHLTDATRDPHRAPSENPAGLSLAAQSAMNNNADRIQSLHMRIQHNINALQVITPNRSFNIKDQIKSKI